MECVDKKRGVKSCNNLRVARVLSYILLLISAVGFFAWNVALDYQDDDFLYSHYFPGEEDCIETPASDFEMCVHPKITTWAQVFKSSCHHFVYWANGRFAHPIKFALAMFPKSVTDVAHAIVMLLMMWGLARLSSGRRWAEHPLRLGVTTLFVWIVWPWNDLFGSSVYFINYAWSTAFVLCFVILFQQLSRESSWGRITWTSIVGFVAAAMHEGISVPFMAGIGGYIVLGWFYGGRLTGVEKPSKGHVISACCFLAGILCITVFCPGFMENRLPGNYVRTFSRWYDILMFNVYHLYYVYIGLFMVVILLYKIGVQSFWNGITGNIIVVLSFPAGFILAYLIGPGILRSMWALYVISTILLVKGLSAFEIFRRREKISTILAMCCGVLMIAFFIDLVSVQMRRTNQIRQYTNEITQNLGQGVYYADIDAEKNDYWWMYYMSKRALYGVNNLEEIQHRIGQCENQSLIVLPTAYREIPLDSLPLIPGTAKLRGVYPNYFTTTSDFEALYKDWKYVQLYTKFEFPTGVSPIVKYSPASIFRLFLNPKWSCNELESLYPYYQNKIVVTQEMRDRRFVGDEVDTIYVYAIECGELMLNGMRPVRIDIPDGAKKQNGI